MGRAKTKEECRKYIIEQAKNFLCRKQTIYVLGKNQKDVDYIYSLLITSSLRHCKFLKGGNNFLKNLDMAQIMLLQGHISGILFADRSGLNTFEKNLRIETCLERCFEVPYYFYNLTKREALDRVIECFSPMNMGGRINLIQFDITDKCNLNCALCSHFSPLVKNENRYSIKQFISDVGRLQELTEHIESIGLWGGETLLHPELDRIIDICREAFPESGIEVGTNGILIPSISDEILNAIQRNNCSVRISGYPPTMKILDKIEKRLEEKEIRYSVVPIDRFFKRYELPGIYDIKERHAGCGSKVCHVVKDGTYSSCYVPYGTQVFNLYFGKKFDVNDSIYGLDDELLDMISFTEKIKGVLDICRYCGDIEMHPWKTVGEDKDDISSWIRINDEYNIESDHDRISCNTDNDSKKGCIGKLFSIFDCRIK